MFKNKLRFSLILAVSCAASFTVDAQVPLWQTTITSGEKKSEKYEERKLPSEKTEEKKFGLPRHFIHNTVSHYNYYFNASEKLKAVMEKARMENKDDYSKLLPFYAYTLENTATQKNELDSVIYKCTAGILLHDLRTDWVDNFYLLMGESYLMRNEIDSAIMTFQFINYNLFPRKKHEDEDRIVGTRDDAAGSAISIANPEKRNIVQKVFTLAPSRNDALIWLVRSLIEQESYGEAAGIINTLQYDPNMPKRLVPFLEEVDSYWFYRQGVYDSAAVHLEKALSNADSKEDKSRWEYLLAQLYEMGGKYEKASDYYNKAAKHTTDPLMDIHARLNDAKMLRADGSAKEKEANIDKLVHMARKDKYDGYQDIIYYSAGEIALEKPDTAAAKTYFAKSLKYNVDNVVYKNKVFLRLADIAFAQRNYRLAFAFYDSLQTGDTTLGLRVAEIQARRNALSKIVVKLNIIEREDSLQRIAAMSPTDRDAFIRAQLKKLRKAQCLKDEDNNSGTAPLINFGSNKNQPVDLFQTGSKGEWYFYNNSAKGKGASEFRGKWGDRANVDNWRRKSALNISQGNNNLQINANIPADKDPSKKDPNATPNTGAPELSFDGLMKDVPMEPGQLKTSNDKLAQAMFELGKLYQDELQNYGQAVETYEECLRRYPDILYDGDLYFGLYFSYGKLGNTAKANYYKNLLLTKFPNSKPGKIVVNPAAFDLKLQNPEATKEYESIYSLFIEGKFDEAEARKQAADSKYGQNYWTPQLLYIEAVHQVRQKNDTAAALTLANIIGLYPGTPLAEKAAIMQDVLKRRKEIEDYLTNLQVTRMSEDAPIKIDDKPVVTTPVTPVITKPLVDTVKKAAPPMSNGTFTLNPSATHFVIMILDKVDATYVNESKNAFERYNRETFYSMPLQVNKDVVSDDVKLLVTGSFANADEALVYYDKVRRAAPSEVSWLPAAKYSFAIITQANLDVLKANKDIAGYKKLLNTQYPNRF